MVKNTLLETLNNYKNVTVEPETAEVDIATYISVAGHGSFTEQIFYSRISALFEVANALKELFDSSKKSYEGAILECLYWYDEKNMDLLVFRKYGVRFLLTNLITVC